MNYPGFESGELRAFYEFVSENDVSYEWIGMNGSPTGIAEYEHQNVAVVIHRVNDVHLKLKRLEQKVEQVLCLLQQ